MLLIYLSYIPGLGENVTSKELKCLTRKYADWLHQMGENVNNKYYTKHVQST